MRNKACLALGATLFATQAMAVRIVGDVSEVQSETILLKAQVSRATAQAELDAKSRGAGVGAEAGAPVVKNVGGRDNKLYATFLYSSGAVMDGGEGDTILGGYKVALVSVNKVELVKDGKRLQVGFSATVPSASAQSLLPGAGQPFMPSATSFPR